MKKYIFLFRKFNFRTKKPTSLRKSLQMLVFSFIFVLSISSALALEIGPEDPVIGNSNAPITIVQFADFEDPFSSRFAAQTFPEIKEKYIDTGKVKFVYKDFPLSFHDNAIPAAKAAQCANEQGYFWLYYEILYKNYDQLDQNSLISYAREIGMNIPALDRCIRRDSIFAEIQDDIKDGQDSDVKGTPAFFVNGKQIAGAMPFRSFESVIEEELANLGGEVCSNGCGEGCASYGTRIVKSNTAMYCDLSGEFERQKSSTAFCQNNYECLSGLCSYGKCMESVAKKKPHIILRLLDWIEKVFGI